MAKKEFQIHVSDKTGEFIDSLEQSDFSGTIGFTEKINHGFQLFSFTYRVESFDEYDDNLIKEMNRVELIMTNKSHREGKNIFAGYISKIKKIQTGLQKELKVDCLGIQYLMATNYEITHNFSEEDPKAMIEYLIDDFNLEHPRTTPEGSVWVEKTDLNEFGTDSSLDLSESSWFQGIVKSREISDENWFFRFGSEWGFKFAERNSEADHIFDISKHISGISIDPDPESIENIVKVDYNGGEVSVSDLDSIASWGRRKRATTIDSEISDETTATRRANTILAEKKDQSTKIIATITDSYDLESIRVGDVVEFVGVKEGSFLDQNLLQVWEITYQNGYSSKISFNDYDETLAKTIGDVLN